MALAAMRTSTSSARVCSTAAACTPCLITRAAARAIPKNSFATSTLSALRPTTQLVVPTFALRQKSTVVSAAATDAEAVAPEETFQYQAEVDRLMDMIVNSLYSNREVFLRELISNASDALDKIRFLSLTKPELMKGDEALEIRIKADKANNAIIIEDTGVGMTREQLLSNLGTIARSGTRKFMEAMKEAKGDTNLIGQFGVGFYSSFLVADRVIVQTKSPEEDQQWEWESSVGSHQFTIKKDDTNDISRGTRVTLFLKEDAQEMADPVRLARLIKQYSQFIQFPIKLYSAKKEPRKVVDEEATKRKQEAEDNKAKERGEETVKTVEPVMKTIYDEKWDWRVENESKPIWTRSPKDVSDEQYNEFFKQTFAEFVDPLAHVHFNVEGTIEFSAILFVPGMAPFEQNNYMAKSKSIKLYVRRVFISDEFDDDLMPKYLSFIKGVVDSSDLPLNVSREILQESRIVRVIRKQLVRRSLDMLEELATKEGGEDYKTFWESFGRNIKVGVIEDQDNKDKLAKLLRFYSSKSDDSLISLEQYVDRMKGGQKAIYYMAADNIDAARAAPFVEQLVKRDMEVLFLTEAVDEATIQSLSKFKDFDLVDVTKEGLDLGEEEGAAKKMEELQSEFKEVTEFLKQCLGDRVEKVTVSNRLTDSPCALVTSKFGWSANMERIMKSQTLGDSRALEYMRGRKIMEINPDHDIVRGVKLLLQEQDQDRAGDLAELMYETALLTSGFQLDSPKDYANKVYTLMKIALGYDIMPDDVDDLEEAPSTPPPQAAQAPKAAKAASEKKKPAAEKLETVEPEVMDDADPWGKKK